MTSDSSDILSSSDDENTPLAAEKTITLSRKVNFSSFISIPPVGIYAESTKTQKKKKLTAQKVQKRKTSESLEENLPEITEHKRTLSKRKSAGTKRKNTEQRVKIPNPNPKTRLTEMDWHLDNIRTILNCSNATPIHAKEDDGYSCSYCFQKFSKLTELKKHCFSNHKKGKPDFLKMRPGKILSKHIVYLDISSLKCRLCRSDIDSLEMLMEHLQNAHLETMHLVIKNQIMPLRVVEDRLVCAVCSIPVDFDKVADHMSQHYRNYVCEFCDASFVIRCKMLDHKKSVHDVRITENFNKRFSFTEGIATLSTKYAKQKKVIIIKPKVHLKVVSKKSDELRKHEMNIRTLLLCSNATPIRKHTGLGFKCCFCVRDFSEPSELKSHTREAHDNAALANFKASQAIQSFVVKLDITDLSCTLCHSPFTTLEDLTDHLTTNHNKTYHTDIKSHIIPFCFSDPFHCVKCTAKFSNFKRLHEHMSEHFRNHICEVCGKGYVNLVQFQTHMYRHNKGLFACSVCPKVFDTRVKWRAHERATHVLMNKRSKCGYCGERFSDYGKKQAHEAEKHGVKRVLLQCRACEKGFGNQRALTVHIKKHQKMERKFAK